MKKVLSTALILGALYGTASAAPITSPIYAPEAGKILMNVGVGYTNAKFDKNPDGYTDKLEDSWNIDVDGKMGILDQLSLNYGFSLDFARKLEDEDQSAKFTNFYFGVTGRVVDSMENKLDLILNIGQEEEFLFPGADSVYIDLAVRYGLELDMYNLGASIFARYVNDWESEPEKVERDFVLGVKLENEFIFTEDFTVGLDLFYSRNGEVKYKNNGGEVKTKSFNNYGFDVDANFALTPGNNFIGAYYAMKFSDVDAYEAGFKDPIEYKFGLKYVAQF